MEKKKDMLVDVDEVICFPGFLKAVNDFLDTSYQIDDRLPKLDNDINLRILFPSYHNKNITNEELKEKGVIRAGFD